MKKYIASTLTASQSYSLYVKGTAVMSVVVNGGNSLVNQHLVTLEGAITSVTTKQADMLKKHPLFKFHMKKGFVKFTEINDPVKATSDLESRDLGAPLMQGDIDAIQTDARTGIDIDFKDTETPQRAGTK